MGKIIVKNVGKAYKNYPQRWSRLLEWTMPFCSKSFYQLTWILQDINFMVEPGEAVGIVGINGAGKSTLLKLITGTTRPTTGEISINGRVAAMLELGMGFHPDFTGRQNITMAAQLLGFDADEIKILIPRIEEFAEIGDYIDEPVRVYSSGMQVRLAFSVATARRPDVLIIDEALSVGDVYFQHKSFARIREFSEQGTTLLIVSHDKAAIQSLCDRAIMLNDGRIAKEGMPEEVMDFYNAMLADRENNTITQEKMNSGKTKTVSGTGEAIIDGVDLLNERGEPVEVVGVGQQIILRFTVLIKEELPELVLGYMIKDRLGQPVFGTNTFNLKEKLTNLHPGETIDYQFKFLANIGEGAYSVAVALHAGDTHISANYEWRDFALVFNVINLNYDRFVGVAWLPPELECSK